MRWVRANSVIGVPKSTNKYETPIKSKKKDLDLTKFKLTPIKQKQILEIGNED